MAALKGRENKFSKQKNFVIIKVTYRFILLSAFKKYNFVC